MTQPIVSFAIASFNSRGFLEAAVRSALAQNGVAVEVLIADDHSTDGSDAVAQDLALADPRVRYLRTPENAGPAAARNLALSEARGEWFAVLDSDDLIDPERTAILLAEAVASGADMIADDLLLFDDDRKAAPALFLDSRRAGAPGWIGLADYLEETRMFGRRPNLGFLKPMIRRSFLSSHAVSYDQALRIAEDDALAIRCLRAGARYRLLPRPLYFYRKHGRSVTVRLGTGPADAMKAANERLLAELGTDDPRVGKAMRRRAAAMRRAWGFTHFLEAARARDAGLAVGAILRCPGAMRLIHQPIMARLRRWLPAAGASQPQAGGERTALVVSKQSLIGATNGSSAYLLAIVSELRRAGWAVHLAQPSDAIFGRTPFFRLLPEMDVFAGIKVAGAWRLGPWLIARSPCVWTGGARAVASRLASRMRLGHLLPDRKLPWSVATPWQRESSLFIAGHAGLRPELVLADYVFCSSAFAALCDPSARRVIVMHDRFSSRAAQFSGEADSVAGLDEAEELGMLGRADAVLAIQPDEAAFVEGPAGTTVLKVPMPAAPVAGAVPGNPDRLLFVGSDTAPNIIGLRWFLDAVWPQVRRMRPSLRLDVAGSVRSAFAQAVPGVSFHGVVRDLAPLYRDAGIVISPLQQGSGLKIKLVDALAQGKACVVTGTTLQGVEWLAGEGAVERADTVEDSVAAILRLAADDAVRARLGEAALNAARREFGPDAAFASLRAWLDRRKMDE